LQLRGKAKRGWFERPGVDDIQNLHVEFFTPITDSIQVEIETFHESFWPGFMGSIFVVEGMGYFLLKGE
jgi:hypothetical protein